MTKLGMGKHPPRPYGPELVQAVRGVVEKTNNTAYSHVRNEIPGISTKSITRAFRELAHRGILIRGPKRGSHGTMWHVVIDTPTVRKLPFNTTEEYVEVLCDTVRDFVLHTGSASSSVLQYVFKIGPVSCDRIMHHLRREGIVTRGKGKGSHWRVLVTRKQAKEQGLFKEIHTAETSISATTRNSGSPEGNDVSREAEKETKLLSTLRDFVETRSPLKVLLNEIIDNIDHWRRSAAILDTISRELEKNRQFSAKKQLE